MMLRTASALLCAARGGAAVVPSGAPGCLSGHSALSTWSLGQLGWTLRMPLECSSPDDDASTSGSGSSAGPASGGHLLSRGSGYKQLLQGQQQTVDVRLDQQQLRPGPVFWGSMILSEEMGKVVAGLRATGTGDVAVPAVVDPSTTLVPVVAVTPPGEQSTPQSQS